ncbi:hypothetical protein Bhyg_14991, partial [Pseudolycoriella hygida]
DTIVLVVECIDQVPENESLDGVVQFENCQDCDSSTFFSDEIDNKQIVDLDSISGHDSAMMEIVLTKHENQMANVFSILTHCRTS